MIQKRSSAFGVLILMLMAPCLSSAAQVDTFEGGLKDATAIMEAPDFSTTVRITLPAECHIRRAVLNVSTEPGDPGVPGHPEGVKLLLDDDVLWGFNGTGYGAFGLQDRFSNESRTLTLDLDKSGGSGTAKIRLPKKAVVEETLLSLDCGGPGRITQTGSLNGSVGGESFGTSIANAGDVNGDGFEDIIVGSPSYSAGGVNYRGRACLFYGGRPMNSTPDFTFNGTTNLEYMGSAVSSAGDVNGDGYDDVIVGSYAYTSGTIYYTGRAQIFFGGPGMDNLPEVTIIGSGQYDYLGSAVAGAGDVNGDGYDDVLVGAPYSSLGATYAGRAGIYYGGPAMDNVTDVALPCSVSMSYFGSSVAGAGDPNQDGYDDVVVGARNYNSGAGRACVYFGGGNMDNVADLTMTGLSTDGLGTAVLGAGDLNADGCDDIVITASFASSYAGAAYAYWGGPAMDNVADLVLQGEKPYDSFGASAVGRGDVNGDGHADLVVGAPRSSSGATYAGMTYIYYGGPGLDNKAEANFTGPAAYAYLGTSAALADINRDGWAEVIAGATGMSAAGAGTGGALIYGMVAGILDPGMAIGGGIAQTVPGYVNTTVDFQNFTSALNSYMRGAQLSGGDAYGNGYYDVPLTVSAASEGRLAAFGLRIHYSCIAFVQDFTGTLNKYLAAHKHQKNAAGDLTVPMEVLSRTPGRLRLMEVGITLDEAPRLATRIPDVVMDEDTVEEQLIDLYEYFQDDFDTVASLGFNIICATNASIVGVSLSNNRYISVDALEGEQNDNWTGVVSMAASCTDRWGSMRESNHFNVIVQNVNDPPVITSVPLTNGTGGADYFYQVTAVDGDNNTLTYALARAPENMYIGNRTGKIEWTPAAGGIYPVSVSVGDGLDMASQNFSIIVPNRAPRILSEPPANAYLGVQFVYNASATDEDGQALTYSVSTKAEGLAIDPLTGRISWTPAALGDFTVTVAVSDGEAKATQKFILRVLRPNRAPMFTSSPVTNANVGVPYVYGARAYDEDHDPLAYRLLAGAPGLALDGSTGALSWTPEAAGSYPVTLLATDGRGGEARQEFVIVVGEALRAKVAIELPGDGQTLRGTVAFSGSAAKGLRDIVGVQARIDSGDWRTARGNSSWRFLLDTTNMNNGEHTLEVRAFDGVYFSEPAKMSFVVDNQPAAEQPLAILVLAAVVTASAAAGTGALLWRLRLRR